MKSQPMLQTNVRRNDTIKNSFRISEKLPNLLPLHYYLLLAKNLHKSRKSEELRVNSEKVKSPYQTIRGFLAGALGLEPRTNGFGDRDSTN